MLYYPDFSIKIRTIGYRVIVRNVIEMFIASYAVPCVGYETAYAGYPIFIDAI